MEKTTLDEALENLDEEFAEDIEEEEVEDTSEEEDTDLEYDEDGNVIIPDDDEGDEEAIAEDADKGEGEDKTPVEAKATDYHEKLLSQAKDTLEKLGVKAETDEEVLAALARLAAEAEDKTPEEYLAEKAEKDKLDRAKKLIEEQDREAIRKADLEAIQAKFPETLGYKDISELPHFKEYCVDRMKGENAVSAYAKNHYEEIRAAGAESGKRNSLVNSKSHLQPSAPKGAKDDSVYISKGDMAMFRDLMPDKTDDEIREYYKRTQK